MFGIQRASRCRAVSPYLIRQGDNAASRLPPVFDNETIGLGDTPGFIMEPANQIRDRWTLVNRRDLELSAGTTRKVDIVLARGQAIPGTRTAATRWQDGFASPSLTRNAFIAGDISTVMSPRTVITWAENRKFSATPALRFRLTFSQQVRRIGTHTVAEILSALFCKELPESAINVVMS